MRLSDRTIEQVRERADIVEIVSSRVALKKSGRNNLLGLCPFHADRSPSFSVSPERGLYYCFSCEAGGDAIKFISELDSKSFTDTVLELAERYNIHVEASDPDEQRRYQQERSRREQQFEILALAARFYASSLRTSEGRTALDYLFDVRSLDDSTVERFQLGYAPDDWTSLLDYLHKEKEFSTDLIESVGLIIERRDKSGFYDRFRNRLIIPICDERGRVVGFGGRALEAEQKPKYINSPESELFSKSRNLFPLHLAKDAIKRADAAVFVEGFFDAIALHETGIENVVATQGTALQDEQILSLCKLTESKRIYLNFDTDTAGRAAVERAIASVDKFVDSGAISLRIVEIPEAKDAGELLQSQGVERYRSLLENAPTWLEWQINRICCSRDLSQPEQFQAAGKECVALLRKIKDEHLQTLLLSRAAALLANNDPRSVPLMQDRLVAALRRVKTRSSSKISELSTSDALSALERAEQLVLLAALYVPYQRDWLSHELSAREIDLSEKYRRAFQAAMTTQSKADAIALLKREHLQELLVAELPSELDELLVDALNCIERETLQTRKASILQQWQNIDDVEQLKALQRQLDSIRERLSLIV